MKKVVQIVNSLESAGRAGLRLHNAFIEDNISSHIISLHPGNSDSKRIRILGRRPRLISILDGKIQAFLTRKASKQFGMFSFPVLGTNLDKIKEVKEADVIYLHWVLGGFLNLSGIEKLVRLGKPTIIVLHDMWMITGGCHHSFSCEKFKTECNDCPIFLSRRKKNLVFSQFKRKLKLFSKYDNFFFVSVSKWLLNCAQQSALTRGKPVYYIPNTLDNKIFKPLGKEFARKALNLEPDRPIISFGAVGIESPYKGWLFLKKALDKLCNEPLLDRAIILIFGKGMEDKNLKEIPFEVKHLRYLNDEISLPLVYNAADVFIAPSVAEAFGYVIYESLSCGTPVVAFNVGGIPDQIEHKVNGYLARPSDVDDLANGVIFCLEKKLTGKVLPPFENKLAVNQHKELISSLLAINM